MAQKLFEIPSIGPVLVVKKRGNRNLRLSFARDGSVRVSIPYWTPYQAGLQFAIKRRDWIVKHRPQTETTLAHDIKIGKAHRLVFDARNDIVKPTVKVGNNLILVKHPALAAVSSPSVQAAASRGTLRALKLEADQLLPQRLRQLASQHHFTFASVTMKRLHSRWGSCSQAQDITLNIYLMQLPWQLIDYVLLHELVHTEHLDHSETFWKRFEKVLPGAKQRRKELKAYRTMITPRQ